jgi:hypothetical protein
MACQCSRLDEQGFLSQRYPSCFEIRHGSLAHLALQHPRQIRAAHAAPIIHPVCGSSRAVGGNHCQQIDHLAVAPALLDQPCDPILTGADRALDPKSAELAL